MKTKILATKNLTTALLQQAKNVAKTLKTQPQLAVILVGDNSASQVYVNLKKTHCERIGIAFRSHHLPYNISQSELLAYISLLNNDKNVTGIVVQLPLPNRLNSAKATNAVTPLKDVDGLTKVSWQYLLDQKDKGLLPATPLGIMRLLAWGNISIKDKNVVVIGRSRLVGHPTAILLEQAGANVTICSKETPDIPEKTRKADVVICAAGCPNLIMGENIKEGAAIIDVGINAIMVNGKRTLVGDTAANVSGKAGVLTPVPGGVGPMTVASLLTNVVDAALLQQGLPKHAWII